MICRHCKCDISLQLIDLGVTPPSNAYVEIERLNEIEKSYSLKVLVCEKCWLVQTKDVVDAAELFSHDYAYFSSYSTSWLEHAKAYVKQVERRFSLGGQSLVAEIASNDGYLLQYFKEKDIPCYGIEPTVSASEAAKRKGLDTIQEFFSAKIARALRERGRQADLVVANNVLAHVPNINDFLEGVAIILKKNGIATFEFPHVVHLIREHQFDTIYHEHYSYLSLTSLRYILEGAGLCLFDVQKIATHGGSLRVFVQLSDGGGQEVVAAVDQILNEEEKMGVSQKRFYLKYQERAEKTRDGFREFLLRAKEEGKTVVGYGAAAKGNTLLNFAGINTELLSYIVDQNPAKQGKFTPGSGIPIVTEDHLRINKPDYVIIFPWNLKREVMDLLGYITVWGGRFVIAVPEVDVL
jgi:SAM-dependent methyltransferase